MADGTVRAHVIVRGVVQGVWFRGSTQDQAERLGLGGWVRNLPDGSVEAAFEGPEEAVREAVAWVGVGPRSAIVESVETEWETPVGERDFRMRH